MGEGSVADSLQNTEFWVYAGYYTSGKALKYVRHFLTCYQGGRCMVNESEDCSEGSKVLLQLRQLNGALWDWLLFSESVTEFLNGEDLQQTFLKWLFNHGLLILCMSTVKWVWLLGGHYKEILKVCGGLETEQ